MIIALIINLSRFQVTFLKINIMFQANLSKCNDVMEEIARESYESMLDIVSSSNTNTNTAVNVLDREWPSSSSDCSTTALISDTTNTPEARGDFKRQKISISSFRSEESFQLSHFQQCL